MRQHRTRAVNGGYSPNAHPLQRAPSQHLRFVDASRRLPYNGTMKRTSLICLLAVLIPVVLPARVSTREIRKLTRNLPQHQKQWFELVYHISTPRERDTFLKLENDRDRNAFMELFWKKRDPSRGTPQNEFQEEHLRRFSHANQYFGHGSSLAGWQTDRGKIYILLGPPTTADEFSSSTDLRPMLIWDYSGKPLPPSLPPAFRVVFYKEDPADDYELYMPSGDGPHKLLQGDGSLTIQPHDYQAIWNKLSEISPTAAASAFSLIPGETTGNAYTPSLRSTMVLTRIYDLPEKTVDSRYATDFLSLKGLVDVDVLDAIISCQALFQVRPEHRLGLSILHLALRPERLSVDYSRDQDRYYAAYTLKVFLSFPDGRPLHEEGVPMPLYMSKEDLQTRFSQGVVLTHALPVPPGTWTCKVLLQNAVNREVAFEERTITVPDTPGTGTPLLFSTTLHPADPAVLSPFQTDHWSPDMDPAMTFGREEPLHMLLPPSGSSGTVFICPLGEPENRVWQQPLTPAPDAPPTESLIDLPPLPPGEYESHLEQTGQPPLVQTLTISPRKQVTHPPNVRRPLAVSKRYYWLHAAALQLQKAGRPQDAQGRFADLMALEQKPANAVLDYARFLMEQNQAEQVVGLLEHLDTPDDQMFARNSLLGQALLLTDKPEQALPLLEEAARMYNSDAQVLNLLGHTHLMLNHLPEARRAFEASLRIRPDQEGIQKQVEALKRGQKQP